MTTSQRPAAGPPGIRPAGLMRRLAAMVYDALLVVALWMVSLFVLVTATGGEAVPRTVTQPLAVIELFAFFAYFWLHRGQTLGMRAWRLRVRAAGGGPLTPTQVLRRFAGAVVSFATLGLGYLWLLVDRQHRALPDIVSGTEVVLELKGSV